LPSASKVQSEVRRSVGPAARVEIAGRGTEHPPHTADPDRGEGRVGQHGDADGDVDALLDHVHDPVDEEAGERDLRIAVQ
jgi:hypothetical protein